jgi:hypothetical protein
MSEGKRLLVKPSCRWEDNIIMDFKGIGTEGVIWMRLPQDMDQWWAVVNTVRKLRVP